MRTVGKKGLIKQLTASGAVSTSGKSAIVKSFELITETTNAEARLYNSNGGDEKWRLTQGSFGLSGIKTINWVGPSDFGILCTADAFCSISGAGCVVNVLYDEIEG